MTQWLLFLSPVTVHHLLFTPNRAVTQRHRNLNKAKPLDTTSGTTWRTSVTVLYNVRPTADLQVLFEFPNYKIQTVGLLKLSAGNLKVAGLHKVSYCNILVVHNVTRPTSSGSAFFTIHGHLKLGVFSGEFCCKHHVLVIFFLNFFC